MKRIFSSPYSVSILLFGAFGVSTAVAAPAAPTIYNWQNGMYTNLAQQTITGGCVSGNSVRVFGDIVGSSRTVSCSGGRYSSPLTLAGTDGRKIVRVTQRDSSGTSAQTSRSINFDQRSPGKPTITSPTEGTIVRSAQLTLKGNCENLARLRFSGNIQGAPIVQTCVNGNYTQAVVLQAGDGEKSLWLAQTDRAGNTSASTRRRIQMVLSAPPPTPTPNPTPTPTPVPSTGNIRLAGKRLYHPNGNQIIARGPELVTARFDDTANIDRIAATGANAVRLLLTIDAINGMTPQGFDAILARAAAHKMTVWVSLFTWNDNANRVIGNAFGGGNFFSLQAPAGTGTCSRATPGPCYLAVWDRPWLKTLVDKYRNNVVIDATQEFIGVQPGGTEAGWTEWSNGAQASIRFFRSRGYTQPLEVMAAFQGRDLAGIVRRASEILAADSVKVNGQSQTMFGWQAYWADEWYKTWQGGLLLGSGGRLTATQAMNRFVAGASYPIQVGFDNYAADTGAEYREQMAQARADGISWLWWSWQGTTVECPLNGGACQNDVVRSSDGFAGAVKP